MQACDDEDKDDVAGGSGEAAAEAAVRNEPQFIFQLEEHGAPTRRP